MSLVFFLHFDGEKKFILMGRFAPGKRLQGIRNGFGGKFDEKKDEDILDCAIRETREETSLEISKKELKRAGKIIDGNIEVEVFFKVSKDKFEPPQDNAEFVDIRWFDLDNSDTFVSEMLPGNEAVVKSIAKVAEELRVTQEIKEEFEVDETNYNNPELRLWKSKMF